MTNTQSINASNHCFVCGRSNPIGLKIKFQISEDRCIARFVPGKDCSGWKDTVHGGILYSILDDAMANWLFLQGTKVMTVKGDIKYRKPLAVLTPILIEAWQTKERRNLITMESHILLADSRQVIAQGSSTFIKVNR